MSLSVADVILKGRKIATEIAFPSGSELLFKSALGWLPIG
jgi:hypothetical protein